MNNSFSFSRLWQLILKQWIENARFYLLYTLATLGIIALLISFWMFTEGSSYQERNLYLFSFIALYICGSLFASLQFEFLARKDKGVYWLSFPASHFEKLACAVFYTFIVFNALFVVCFLFIRRLAISHIEINIVPDGNTWFPLELPFHQTDLLYFIYAYIALQAFYLLGSVYFTRFSFVKTTVIGAALILGFFLYARMLDKYILGDGYRWDSFIASGTVPQKTEDGISYYKIYSLPAWISDTVILLVKFGWAPVFWVITGKRLAEKEI